MHARAVGGVDHNPPVADLVTEGLDQQGAIIGKHCGRLALGVQIGREGG